MNDNNQRKFTSQQFNKSTETSSFKRKLLYYLKFENRSIIGKMGLGIAGYLVFYNLFVYLWKGPNHPVNNFMWRIKKANGTLSEELAEKERILFEFHKSKFSPEAYERKTLLSSIHE
uniref:Transmembrane protein n=1 Tax=Strongyloides stercoralis TaxID=6248 RepID=A0A0K0DW00_STRER